MNLILPLMFFLPELLPLVPLVPLIVNCYIHPFQLFLMMFMRIKFKMEFVLSKKTCDIIHNDYVWDSFAQQESTMQVDVSPFSPLPHYLDIFQVSIMSIVSFKELFSDDVNSDHNLGSGISDLHLNMERKNLVSLISLIHHLIIVKKQRMKFLVVNLHVLWFIRLWGSFSIWRWNVWS